MKILIIEYHASPNAGGAEKSMANFATKISEDNLVFLAYHNRGELIHDPSYKNVYKDNIQLRLNHLSIRGVYDWFMDLFFLTKWIKKEKFDLIITHLVHISPLLACVKVITGVNFCIYYKWVCSFEDVGLKVRFGNKFIYRSAAVSNFVSEYWKSNGVNADKIKVVPEGVSIFDKQDAQTEQSKAFRLGFAGRIVEEKGLDDLIFAVKILRDSGVDIILKIAGTFNGIKSEDPQDYHLYIEKIIKENDLSPLIVFDGFVSPLEKWIQQLDLMVVPSTCQDAQPLVMMQSMASGVPVIATNVGGVPEVLSGPFSCLIVPPSNPQQLADKIFELYKKPLRLKKIGNSLQSYVLEKYTIDMHVKNLKLQFEI